MLLSAEEIRQQERYVHQFHQRRLRPGPDGQVDSAALADRAEFTQDYVTNIVVCQDCGLVFRNPRPRARSIESAYIHDHYGEERLRALFSTKISYYRSKARALEPRLPAGQKPRVVEVGSFVGAFLAAGQELDWDLIGVDPGKEVTAFCRERGLPVFQGTLAELPWEPGSVDCVACWNTFDQLPDPTPTLEAACRLLRPGGILVVRVPNGACLRLLTAWLRRVPWPVSDCLRRAAAWNNLLVFPYLYGYSPGTLERLFGRYGMARVAVSADILPPQADAQTKRWAAWEERQLKRMCRLAARIQWPGLAEERALAPWIDAVYRV